MAEVEEVLQRELEKAGSERDALVRQREGVQARITELEQVIAGLEHVLRKRPASVPTDSQNGDWVFLNRAQAVQRLLEQTPQSISIHEITKELKRKGRRGDTERGVSGVITRLKKARKVQPAGQRGYWIWAEHAQTIGEASEDAV